MSDSGDVYRSSAHAGVRFFCHQFEYLSPSESPDARILVAGCGDGMEAAYISRRLPATVEGVDLRVDRAALLETKDNLSFREADLLDLPYDDDRFDAVFYHHVIEHLDDPYCSIQELARVLRKDGHMFLGTPNRHRLIGNLGAYNRTAREKLSEVVREWRFRLSGRFRNEFGAHAGFSKAELDAMLAPHFRDRIWVTNEYLRFKYSRGLIGSFARIATSGPWSHILAPSIYVIARKASASV